MYLITTKWYDFRYKDLWAELCPFPKNSYAEALTSECGLYLGGGTINVHLEKILKNQSDK